MIKKGLWSNIRTVILRICNAYLYIYIEREIITNIPFCTYKYQFIFAHKETYLKGNSSGKNCGRNDSSSLSSYG